MDILKLDGNDFIGYLNHSLRDNPSGEYTNQDIDLSLSEERNIALIRRGNSVTEIEKWRKKKEKEIFQYQNRSNLTHGISLCIRAPSNLPEKEKEKFWNLVLDWTDKNLVPREFIVDATVHRDEIKVNPSTGEIISKDHLHLLMIPAVKIDKVTKQNEGFTYKLCARELTLKSKFANYHKSLQKFLEDNGCSAKITTKAEGAGRSIKLTTDELKHITDTTGVQIKGSLTVEKLTEILYENEHQKTLIKDLSNQIEAQRIEHTSNLHKIREKIESFLSEKDQLVKEKESLSRLYSEEKNKSESLTQNLIEKDKELKQVQEQLVKEQEKNKERTWGDSSSWKDDKSHTWDEEHVW